MRGVYRRRGGGLGLVSVARCSRGIVPRSGRTKHGTAERCELGGRGEGRRGGLLFVCGDRGDPPSPRLRRAGAPQLHRADGCAVWGLEPLPWIARRVGSAASMDASVSPVRGLRPLSLLWLSSGRCRGAQAAPPRKSAMPASAKPGWNPIPPGFVASWGRGIGRGAGGGLRAGAKTRPGMPDFEVSAGLAADGGR